MKNKILYIINHYGIKHQLKKFNEESYELIEAINDYENSILNKKVNYEHIEEEFADVLVTLYQFKEFYNLDETKINSIIKNKINRTIDRMNLED